MWLAFANSKTDNAFLVACSNEQFPWTMLKPSIEISGEANASRIAQASSMPGSVSRIIFLAIGSHWIHP
jgi:hypothetical protein